MLTVHDVPLQSFSVIDYLEQHLPSHFDQASQSEYRCCCLFHSEKTPSMYVNVETGVYHCHSCKSSGNVVRLVQRVGKFPTYTDAAEWLLSRYGPDCDEQDESFVLRFTERHDTPPVTYADETVLQQYSIADDMFLSYMMVERGLPSAVLRQFGICYDSTTHSVCIPWRNRHGQLLTVKHRSINSKKFWYSPRCSELRSHLWGLHKAVGQSTVYICEAEIDAMTLWASGKAAVAIGGSHLSVAQVRELRLAGVQAVVPVCDRDKAGAEANRLIQERLKHTEIDVYDAVWPDSTAKDCNELGVDGCRQLTYKIPKIFF